MEQRKTDTEDPHQDYYVTTLHLEMSAQNVCSLDNFIEFKVFIFA